MEISNINTINNYLIPEAQELLLNSPIPESPYRKSYTGSDIFEARGLSFSMPKENIIPSALLNINTELSNIEQELF